MEQGPRNAPEALLLWWWDVLAPRPRGEPVTFPPLRRDALNQLTGAGNEKALRLQGFRGTYWIRTSDLMRVKHAL